ncbi:unnamed protein product [Gongylonema pulchrum]|uniref:Homeobox domain-containing protein n=1 Tax=Gongylonema pulchrum TaxID=637853 RepID=A0A183CXW2_9BILA|nr:unnamed protein product [Gongylonema pulchrum]
MFRFTRRNDICTTEASPVESTFLEEISNANITTSGSNSHSITLSPVVYLLINLSNTENELLERYLREKNYASLKELIDQKKAEFLQVSNKPIGSSAAKETAEDFETDAFLEAPSVPLNFTQEQFEYAQAYHNASIYSIIRALWNTKVEQELPQIDQYAILEYYNEKRAEEEAQQNVLIWLWNLIRRLFNKSTEKYECYANEPTCVRALLDRCNVDELQELQRASDDDDLIMITDLIKDKLDDDPDLYIEYDKWTNANDVPEALKEITRGLSQAQRRAMEKLRRLKLTDKIKDFYRENIEKASSPKQEQIEMFFRRMNKTFARCYNPIIKKENDWFVFTITWDRLGNLLFSEMNFKYKPKSTTLRRGGG